MTEKSPIRNGLVTDRKCTDSFCAAALVILAVGFLGIAAYAVSQGNLLKLFTGVDGDHRICNDKYPLLLVIPYKNTDSVA